MLIASMAWYGCSPKEGIGIPIDEQEKYISMI